MTIHTFVIGVFDSCHVGHVKLLLQCEGRVTVGITGDALVKQTKGVTPLYNEKERAALLFTLPMVHDIVIYEDLDLSTWLRELAPTIWVVPPEYGNDGCPKRMSGLATAAELGIEVRRIERTNGISTTSIKERVMNVCPVLPMGAIACDFHDSFTYRPSFFKALFKAWNGPTYVITGDSDKAGVKRALYEEYEMTEGLHYNELLVCSEKAYEPSNPNHYDDVKMQKKKHIIEKQIAYYFDDNPIYCEYLRNFTCVFSVNLNDVYITEFETVFKHSNVNFQHHVNEFIRQDKSRWVSNSFWKSCDKYPSFSHIKRRRQYELNYVLERLDHEHYQSYMDVGCGDGALLKCLDNLIEFETIHALDLSIGLMRGVPNIPKIKKRFVDINDVSEHGKIIPQNQIMDVLVFGGVLNYCFSNDVLISLLQQFAKGARQVFIRAVCTLAIEDELIVTESVDLQKPYSSLYRTLANTKCIISDAGLKIHDCALIYPEEIESKYNTRQYMFYCTGLV